MNSELLNELSRLLLHEDDKEEMQEIMRRWGKPIRQGENIVTTNYILSQKINNTLKKGASCIEEELRKTQEQLIKKKS